MGPVSSSCPLTSPSCPPFLNKMACFKNTDSDGIACEGRQTLQLGRMLDAGTIHTVITTTNLDNGLKLTLVATFFTMTIFKALPALLTALLLYPANLWRNRGWKFFSFGWWFHFVGGISLNSICHTSWVNILFALCCVNWFCITYNMVFKINRYTVQCKVQICYNNIHWKPCRASWCSAIEIYFGWWCGDAFRFFKTCRHRNPKERIKTLQPFLWGILSQSTLQKWLYNVKFSLMTAMMPNGNNPQLLAVCLFTY